MALREGIDGLAVLGMARGTDDECDCGGWLEVGHFDTCRLSPDYEAAAQDRLCVLLDKLAAAAEREVRA